MKMLFRSALVSVSCVLTAASAVQDTHKSGSPSPETPLPLIIWHGLGDSYNSDGMNSVVELAKKVNPDTYVYPIRLDDSSFADRRNSFFGNINDQVSNVCKEIANIEELKNATAVNAMGFSQGGQFLRAYVERCNNPPVHNLVTFGSQHNGIVTYQACSEGDWLCQGVNNLLSGNTWSNWIQTGLVPAQYYRDPEDLESYLNYSNFLVDINNEHKMKNQTYKDNLKKLNKFVMYLFEEEDRVHPPQSGWFYEVNRTSGEVTKLQDRPMYKEDWLGLKVLDERGALEFLTIPGRHMRLNKEILAKTFAKYFGPATSLGSQQSNISGKQEVSWETLSDLQQVLHL